jgi:hypothetical protein
MLLDLFIAPLLEGRCSEQLPPEAPRVLLAAPLVVLLRSVATLEPALPCANAAAGMSRMAAATNIGWNFMRILRINVLFPCNVAELRKSRLCLLSFDIRFAPRIQ